MNTFYIRERLEKRYYKDVKHRKIFTISNNLAIFIFLNMANLLLINKS